MIEKELEGFPGIKIIELVKREDERGYFLEVLRKSWVAGSISQVSVSLTKPGVIKAFHWHKNQRDIWFLVSGVALVALYDLREDSPGFRKKAALKLDSSKNPKLIIIPKRVAHGYKVLGKKPATMLYA
ncbi:MAG TPA: dTDP-4-dehydrorhamnose 3,5-epimerase family protein, partial [archaeon]|nr:dTDP-4-dehydrorhamnose 3,5-epimerase family protein [archaeon]